MINYIWGGFFIIGIIYSFITGNTEGINNEILTSASSSVNMILQILPIMCLWLGIMQIASDSGLIKKLSRKITPLITKLFPDIPPEQFSLDRYLCYYSLLQTNRSKLFYIFLILS